MKIVKISHVIIMLITTCFIASCKKTSIKKVSNTWTVQNYERSSITDYGTSDFKNTTIIDGKKISQLYHSPADESGDSQQNDGTVNAYTFTINKDGTWESLYDVVFVSSDSIMTLREERIITDSGVWNFLGKNKSGEFKKNERIIFHNLASNNTYNLTIDSVGSSQATVNRTISNYSYATGENTQTYLIKESKRKELQLSLAGGSSFTTTDTNGYSYSNTSTSIMTLVK